MPTIRLQRKDGNDHHDQFSADSVPIVTGGVDTHGQTHHAAVLDGVGRELGDHEFPTTPTGYRALLNWLCGYCQLERVGIEGTGTYGAALTRHLSSAGIQVVEVDRPDHTARQAQGKSDPLDAYSAARAALAGRAAGVPKTRNGQIEAIRALRVARNSAVKARSQTTNQLKALLITAPADLRQQLRGLTTTALITTCARLRPQETSPTPSMPPRPRCAAWPGVTRFLSEEIGDADTELAALVADTAPQLITLPGVGIEVAGQLLTTAEDNPDRLHSEAAFAHPCSVAPIPASSGKTRRHQLNRGGDRAANNALYVVVLNRLRYDQPTRAYATRRTHAGPSKPEIIHCLKRHIARELYHAPQPAKPIKDIPTAA